MNPHPRYPRAGEAVWNPQNLCSNAAPSPANDSQGGFFWCAEDGAGGGGGSEFWGMPSYQKGPGVINPGTTFGNGTTQCTLARNGTPCREVPGISADADEYTPYSEFCTGNGVVILAHRRSGLGPVRNPTVAALTSPGDLLTLITNSASRLDRGQRAAIADLIRRDHEFHGKRRHGGMRPPR